ncbi:MAG: hypothetical protein JNM54_01225 [Candidatus Accumulibacter sp.]|uniref:hypothetical protein n=1 Tax=unclassified Candidatus Accumulibacter TaxID=2619054 RepID=UPI0012C06F0B|nr:MULTISPECIES: hypothetical protein [unclassified Candidatus Accumulibacter]MBL8366528.1 hypothetical protein [Accumulibacter sp.]MQM34299.1 hypothetical protein [Candidatus Accumulibacter phosphatis]
MRNAVLHAIGANASYRLRRSNADKRKAVEMMLADDEWSVLPNTEIAAKCCVGSSLVDSIRNAIIP